MGLTEEDDANPFEDFFFDGDLAILDAIIERLRTSEEHKAYRVHRKVISQERDKSVKREQLRIQNPYIVGVCFGLGRWTNNKTQIRNMLHLMQGNQLLPMLTDKPKMIGHLFVQKE